MAKLVLLVLCATGASARHLLDVNSYLVPSSDVQARRNPENTMERRNIEYGSDLNLNQYGVYIEPLHAHNSGLNRHRINEIPFKINNQNHGLSDDVDSTNNAVLNNEYELKTNVYTSDSYYTTENVIDYNTYSNVNIEMHTRRKNAHLTQGNNYPKETSTLQEPNISIYRNRQETGVLKTNKNSITNINQQPMVANANFSPNPPQQNNLMSQREAIVKNNMNTPNGRRIEQPRINRPEAVVTKQPRFNTTRPIPNRPHSNNKDGMPGRMDEAEEEIPWLWGTSPSDMDTTTVKDDLNDRAAFSGDKCPSDKVKANGMCVDKH